MKSCKQIFSINSENSNWTESRNTTDEPRPKWEYMCYPGRRRKDIKDNAKVVAYYAGEVNKTKQLSK